MKEIECYILTSKYYDRDSNVSVYLNKKDAYKAMINELVTEIINLENSGYSNSEYSFRSMREDLLATLYVPYSDIYFYWNIEVSKIII